MDLIIAGGANLGKIHLCASISYNRLPIRVYDTQCWGFGY